MVNTLLPCNLKTRDVTWIQTKREGVKSGRYGVHKLAKLGLNCKATKCSDTGAGDLGVLTTHETSLMKFRWRYWLNPPLVNAATSTSKYKLVTGCPASNR